MQSALSLEPENFHGHLNLGTLYLAVGKLRGTGKHLKPTSYIFSSTPQCTSMKGLMVSVGGYLGSLKG